MRGSISIAIRFHHHLLSRFFLVPNEVPKLLEARNISSTSIYLNWTAVTNDNGAPLRGYAVYYKLTASQSFLPDKVKTVMPSVTETVVEGLEKYTNYSFRILAFTRNGNGVSSKRAVLLTDEDGKKTFDKTETFCASLDKDPAFVPLYRLVHCVTTPSWNAVIHCALFLSISWWVGWGLGWVMEPTKSSSLQKWNILFRCK